MDQSLQEIQREIQAIINQFYDSISFRKDEKPELEKLKSLFIPDGKLINNNPDEPVVMTVDQFTEMLEAQISRGTLKTFYKHEISHKTEVFGKIAQRFSTYKAILDHSDAKPLATGVSSIQLVKVQGHWLITSMTWNDQSDSLKIPPQYLWKSFPIP